LCSAGRPCSSVLGSGRLRAIARPEAVPCIAPPARPVPSFGRVSASGRPHPHRNTIATPSGCWPVPIGACRLCPRPERLRAIAGPKPFLAVRATRHRSPRCRERSQRPGGRRARTGRANHHPGSAPPDRDDQIHTRASCDALPAGRTAMVGLRDAMPAAWRGVTTARVTFALTVQLCGDDCPAFGAPTRSCVVGERCGLDARLVASVAVGIDVIGLGAFDVREDRRRGPCALHLEAQAATITCGLPLLPQVWGNALGFAWLLRCPTRESQPGREGNGRKLGTGVEHWTTARREREGRPEDTPLTWEGDIRRVASERQGDVVVWPSPTVAATAHGPPGRRRNPGPRRERYRAVLTPATPSRSRQ
jgi:hypothetical protein